MPPPLLSIDTLPTILPPLPLLWTLPLLTLLTHLTTTSTPLTSLSLLPSSSTPTPFLTTTFYIALISTLLNLLLVLNLRIAYGGPRNVDWKREVVVVTGGAGGLGRVIAGGLRAKGAGVAVWDLKIGEGFEIEEEEEEEGEEGKGQEMDVAVDETGVKWYKCDVADFEAVRRTRERVVKDLGEPTVLINNAGIVNGLPLLSLPTTAIEKNFRINLLSHFHTVKAFLPSMLKSPHGGTIVTIASVLGHLGASHLSDYSASKAGLLAFHASLNAELASMKQREEDYPGARNVKTVLVKPGQLSTAMFGSIDTPSSFLGPVVEAKDLATEIVRIVESGMSGVVAAPLYARWIEWMDVLPVSLQRVARWMSGVDKAMEGFGRKKA